MNTLYGVFIGLSYISFILVAIVMSKIKLHIKIDHLIMYIILNAFLSLFGGKVMAYVTSDIEGQTFFQAGLSSYGGLIGGIVSGGIMWIITKRRAFMDISVLSLPLMYAVGKLGCNSAGCCYGIPFEHGIYNAAAGQNVFPVQMTETIVFVIIFGIAFWMYISEKRNWLQVTIIASALAKAGLDYLRDSHIDQVLSVNQIMSIIVCVVVVIITIIWRRLHGRAE